MPVNKHIGKLWFETQEEIDAYDDLMVSNIELKDPSSESENFAIVALRARKEIVPGLSEKSRQQILEYRNFLQTASPKQASLKSFWEWPLYKGLLAIGGSYLIMRELPIRNFYARAFIMAFYLMHLRKVIFYNGIGQGFTTSMIVQHDENFMWVKQEAIQYVSDCQRGFVSQTK